MSPLVLRIVLAVVFALILFDLYLHRSVVTPIPFPPPEEKPLGQPWPQRPQCPFSPSVLSFNDRLIARNYTRGVIRPRFNKGPKPALGRIAESLLPPFLPQPHVLSTKYAVPKDDCSETTIAYVDVEPDPESRPDGDGTEKILVGSATTLERLDEAFHRFAYIIGGTQASLLALVPPTDNLKEKEKQYRARGLDIILLPSKLDFTERYFSLVRAANSHISTERPNTQWLVLMDDDTFFSSLSQISERLSTLSPSKPYWIGALSEAIWQVDTFGHNAFGGAGILLSRNLVETLDKRYDDCAGEDLGPLDMPGDQRLGKCINKVLPRVKLTIWGELHQWDMRPNFHGLFEAGRPLWSFHHFHGASWGKANVLGMSAVATVAGDKSLLRRWVFDVRGSGQEEERDFWVLTNGYSIVRYHVEAGTPDVDFSHTEHTWPEDAAGYMKSVGPLRPVQQNGVTKQRWLLRDVVRVGANVHQFYGYEDATENSNIEIVWLGVDPNSGALLE